MGISMKRLEKPFDLCPERRTILVAFVFATVLTFLAAPVSAHPPSSVIPAYDPATGELRVTITHTVPNPDRHYIGNVAVFINGGLVNETAYSFQPSPDIFTYIYPITAQPGDKITVTAGCNLAGSGSNELTVGSPGSTEPAATPSAGSGILPAGAIAACMVLFLVRHGQ